MSTFSLCFLSLEVLLFQVFFVCLFVFVFLGLHLWHMDIPWLGVRLELHLPAYTTTTPIPNLSWVCDLYHSSRQCQILNPLSEARDRTHILLDTIWVWSTTGTPTVSVLNFKFWIHFSGIREIYFHSSACGFPIFSALFMKENIFSLLSIFGSFVKY